MRQRELLEIINNGESSKIEFKEEGVHPNTLAEEIVAFANFEGGTILIGVDDTGALRGCTRRNLEEFVVNVCRNNIRPPLIPLIEKIGVDKKQILSVTIPRGDTAYSTKPRTILYQGRLNQAGPDATRAFKIVSKKKHTPAR